MDQPATSRPILNANRGVTNVIPYKTIKTDLQRVTNMLFATLKDHYGPFSSFAALDSGRPLVETNFTKDGIGIVESIEFASPQEEWVRKTIAYIGRKIESSVGDGTTSAMMFTCAMLRNMSKHIHEIKPISYVKLRETFDEFLNTVSERMKRLTVSPMKSNKTGFDAFADAAQGKQPDMSPDYDLVRAIAYRQAYTSTHGDKELSRALADIFAKTPPELWERMTYERKRQESDERFSIIESEGQYTMEAKVFSTNMLNKEMGMKFEHTNCKLFVTNDNLRMDSPDWNVIIDSVRKEKEDECVVVVCHERMDTQTYQEINQLISTEFIKNGKKLAIFTQHPFERAHPNVNDFVAIQAICGADVTQYSNGDALIVNNATVKFDHTTHRLSLDNLYEVPEKYKSELRRHIGLDGKHSQFCETIEAWGELGKKYYAADVTKENRELASYYLKLFIKAKYKKQYTLVIGGKAYDNIALVDVVDDAIRAASRGLVHGVTYGNNRSLYKIVCEMIKSHRYIDGTIIWLCKMVKLSLEDIAREVIVRLYPNKKFFAPWKKKNFIDWWFSHSVDLLLYDNTRDWNEQFKDKFVRDTSVCLESSLGPRSGSIIIQPANTDLVMLERFGEIALKFILTESIVIAGGAYVKKGH